MDNTPLCGESASTLCEIAWFMREIGGFGAKSQDKRPNKRPNGEIAGEFMA
jgi:hypothetical protein